MYFKIVELSPIPYEGKTADAVVLIDRDYASYQDAKMALYGYEMESSLNGDWAVFAILAMTHDFPIT